MPSVVFNCFHFMFISDQNNCLQNICSMSDNSVRWVSISSPTYSGIQWQLRCLIDFSLWTPLDQSPSRLNFTVPSFQLSQWSTTDVPLKPAPSEAALYDRKVTTTTQLHIGTLHRQSPGLRLHSGARLVRFRICLEARLSWIDVVIASIVARSGFWYTSLDVWC